MAILTSLFAGQSATGGWRSMNTPTFLDGRRATTAGVDVTEAKSITLSSVFACVRVIAEDVASLPTIIYRRTDDGRGKERASDMPLYRVLKLSPNDEMGAYDFKQALMICALLWGNGYAEIQYDQNGRPVALWPIPPWRVTLTDDFGVNRTAYGRARYYRVIDDTGGTRRVNLNRMLHIKGISGDGLLGWMFATYAREALGLAIAAHNFTSSFFANGAALSGVLTVQDAMKAPEFEDFVNRIRKQYEGATKAHKMLALDRSATFASLSSDPKNTQLLETIQFSVEEIARYFRVTPHKIGHLLRSTFNNIESLDLDHYKSTLRPRLVQLEQEMMRKLLTEGEQESHVIEHMVDAILRADFKTRTEGYASGITNGWLNRNEVRAMENLNPVDGGDRYMIQGAMAAIDDDGTPQLATRVDNRIAPQDDDAEQRDHGPVKRSMMPVFVSACERVVSRECNAIRGMGDTVGARAGEWYAKHKRYVVEQLGPACESLASMVGKAGSGEALAKVYAEAHVEESLRVLESCGDVDKQLEQWTITRPAWMARHLTDEVCDGDNP